MRKYFNTCGVCFPDVHYMVDVSGRVEQIINDLISQNKYFTMNRARQYGKTTILDALYQKLKKNYSVFYLSWAAQPFQMNISFVKCFCVC